MKGTVYRSRKEFNHSYHLSCRYYGPGTMQMRIDFLIDFPKQERCEGTKGQHTEGEFRRFWTAAQGWTALAAHYCCCRSVSRVRRAADAGILPVCPRVWPQRLRWTAHFSPPVAPTPPGSRRSGGVGRTQCHYSNS